MIVITNSGPLMALAKLGLLHLLGRIYGKVEMPEAVYSEAQVLGFSVKGTLGVIVKAYNKQLLTLDEVQIIFNSIIERNDIWIAEELCRRVFERLKNPG